MSRYKLLVLWVLVAVVLLPIITVQAAVQTPCNLGDGRINVRPHRDCGAPVAIFIQGDNIVVLAVDDQAGPDPVAATAPANSEIPTASNTVIGTGTNPISGKPVIISRLTTGEYQLNTFTPEGTAYTVVWYKGAEDLYHLDPVTGAPLDGAQPIVAPDAPNPSAGSANAPVVPNLPPASTTSSTGGESPVATEPVMISMPAAGAVSLSNCQVTTTRIVRMRTAPDETTGEIMTRLPYRSTWTATERTADWFRVIWQSTQGWVSADFLSTTGACDLAAPVAATEEAG